MAKVEIDINVNNKKDFEAVLVIIKKLENDGHEVSCGLQVYEPDRLIEKNTDSEKLVSLEVKDVSLKELNEDMIAQIIRNNPTGGCVKAGEPCVPWPQGLEELRAAGKDAVEYLKKYGCLHSTIIITQDCIKMVSDDVGVSLTAEHPGQEKHSLDGSCI